MLGCEGFVNSSKAAADRRLSTAAQSEDLLIDVSIGVNILIQVRVIQGGENLEHLDSVVETYGGGH